MNKSNCFYSYENLNRALYFKLVEFNRSNFSLDPIYNPIIKSILANKQAIFKSFSNYIKSGKFKADKIQVLEVPKSEFLTRKIAVLSFIDNILYQAVCNYKYLGIFYNNNLNKEICFNQEVNPKQHVFLNKYIPYFNNYIEKQIEYFNKGYVWRHFIDIEKFYDNINLDDLLIIVSNILTDSNDKELILNYLKSLFSRCKEAGIGLPQGPDASIIFATLYLKEFDIFLYNLTNNFDIKILRYQDDIVIMSKEENLLKEMGNLVIKELKKYKLNPNNKTEIAKVESPESLKEKIIKTSHTDHEMYVSNIPDTESVYKTISEIIKRKNVSDTQIRDLKYFLKADKGIYNSISDVVYLYDKLPQTSVSVTRYVFNRYNKNKSFSQSFNKKVKLMSIDSLCPYSKLWLLRSLIFIDSKSNSDLIELILSSDNNWLLNTLKIGFKGSSINFNDLGSNPNPYELIAYGSVVQSIENMSKLIVNNISNSENKDLSLFLWVLSKQNDIDYANVKSNFLKSLDNEFIVKKKSKNRKLNNINFNTDTYIQELKIFQYYYYDIKYQENEDEVSKNKEHLHKSYEYYRNIFTDKLETPVIILDKRKDEAYYIKSKTEVLTDKISDSEITYNFLEELANLPKGGVITKEQRKDFLKNVPRSSGKKHRLNKEVQKDFNNYCNQSNNLTFSDKSISVIKTKQQIIKSIGNGSWEIIIPILRHQ